VIVADRFITPQIVRLSFALYAVAMSSQAVSPLLLWYTHDLRLSGTMLTVFFAVYALGLVPALLLGGAHSDRIGRKAVVVPSVVLVLCAVAAIEAAAAFGASSPFPEITELTTDVYA